MKKSLVSLAVAALFVTSSVFAASSNDARRLSQGIKSAKATVDRAIAAASKTAVEMSADEIFENDAIALPIFIDASTSLGQAADSADAALAAYLAANIALGNYQFAMSCNRMGLSRSKLSRANLAAIRPPIGYLAPFATEIGETITELSDLKLAVGCP